MDMQEKENDKSTPKAEVKKTEKTPVPTEKKEEKKKFVRVAIEEDSEEDEEPKIEDVSNGKSANKPIESKFPLKNAKEIEKHNKEA